MDNLFALIKPVSSSCDLDCKYCFYKDVAKNRKIANYHRMNKETLKNIVREFIQKADKSVTFMFQGGEPTLIGSDFYAYYNQCVLEELKNKGKDFAVHSALQTNGMHITESLAKALSDGHFLVGVSLDGPEYIHNINRLNKKAEGTFSGVMAGIEVLKKYNIDINILSVVTRNSLPFVKSIIDFYVSNNLFYMQFIAAIDSFDKSLSFINDKEFADFTLDMFDVWLDYYQKGTFLSIRFIEDLFANLLTGKCYSCDLSGRCSNQNVIEANGNLYPCDFYVLDEYLLGNTNRGFDNLNTEVLNKFTASEALANECSVCGLFKVCKGGCKRTRLASGHAFLCQSFKNLFAKRAAQIDFVLQNSFKNSLKNLL